MMLYHVRWRSLDAIHNHFLVQCSGHWDMMWCCPAKGFVFPSRWCLQVLAITNAKRVGAKQFVFPGDSQVIGLKRDVAYFITMNPGYQGRQELPENLKVCHVFARMQ